MDSEIEIERFNALEETINFGKRCVDDIGNLFEVFTLVSLKCPEVKESHENQISSLIWDGLFYVSLDKKLFIFSDLKCSSIIFTANFEEVIDVLCCTDDYLLIYLRSGYIHVLNKQMNQITLTKKLFTCLDASKQFFIAAFKDDNGDSGEFLIVTASGIVQRIKIEDEQQEIQSKLLFDFEKNISCVSYLNETLLFGNNHHVWMYNLYENETVLLNKSTDLKKICTFENDFIALSKEGNLIQINPITMQMTWIQCEDFYSNITIQHNLMNPPLLQTYLCKEDNNYIELINYENFEKIYHIKLNAEIENLVPSNGTDEEQVFISKFKKDEYHIQSVCETSPHKHLERLLRKGAFNEAEQFATQHNLNLEEVTKARATAIIDQTTCNSKEVDDLIEIMHQISDYNFIVHCCASVSCEKLEDFRKIFIFGSSLVSPKDLMNDVGAVDIQSLLYTFDTYSALLQCNNEEFDPNAWNSFLLCDFYDYLCKQLCQRNIESSTILYGRFEKSAIQQLTEEKVKKILNILHLMPFDYFFSFLYVFIPKTLANLPSTYNLFLQWIQEYVFYIESKQYQNFPENAINFVNKIIELWNVMMISNPELQDIFIVNKCNLNTLNVVFEALQIIQTLKNNFCVFMPVKHCLEGPNFLVHELLLLEVNDIDNLLQSFIIGYLVEKNIDQDEVFYEEIKKLVSYPDPYWMKLVFILWKNIRSAEIKLNAMKLILQHSEVPWSSEVKELLQLSLKLNHSLVQMIRGEVKNEKIYIVLSRPVYKLRKQTVEQCATDTHLTTIRKIIRCNEPTMQEDVFTLCLSDDIKAHAIDLLIRHYINKSCTNEALDLIDNLKDQEILSFLDLSSFMIKSDLEYREVMWPKLELLKIYINIRNIAMEKVQDCMNLIEKYRYKAEKKLLAGYIILKETTKTHFEMEDLLVPKKELSKFLDLLLTETASIISNDFCATLTQCQRLSTAFDVSYEEILVRLYAKCKNLKLFKFTAEYMYENQCDLDVCCSLPILFSRTASNIHEDSLENVGSDISFTNLENNCEYDPELRNECIHILKKLLAKNFKRSESDISNLDMFQWYHTTFSCIKFNVDDKNPVCTYIDEKISSVVIESVLEVSSLYLSLKGDVPHFLKNTNQSFNKVISKKEFNDTLVIRLPQIIELLCRDDSHFSACNLIICLANSLEGISELDPFIFEFLEKNLLKYNKYLIQKVFASPYLDEDIAFNFLLFYTYEDAMKIIRKALQAYIKQLEKFKAIARIIIKLHKYYNISSCNELTLAKEILLLGKWWEMIDVKPISYKSFTVMPRSELLEKLIHHGSLTSTSQIEEFCEDFNLNINENHEIFLKANLASWKPDYEIQINETGKRVLLIKNNENDLFTRCQEVIKLIPKETVFELINEISSKISMYCYEVFMCISEIISTLNGSTKSLQKNHLLLFLKNYTRDSKPTQTECDEWFAKFPESQNIDPLSEWRLPFTNNLFDEDGWKRLKTEINLYNYSRWFETIPFFKCAAPVLFIDNICSYAVKSVVSDNLLGNSNLNEWVLFSQHKDLFEDVDKCIEYITNLEVATSAAYVLMINTPKGADQVLAAKLCYKYALKYKKNPGTASEQNNANMAFAKVEKKYYNCCTTHILHTYKLADAKYLDLIGNTMDLIAALYDDPRITNSTKLNLKKCPDINKAVDEIAALYKIDISEKRLTLLQNWLCDEVSSNTVLDESICFTTTSNSNKQNDDDDLYIKKVVYVCSTGNTEYWLPQLWKLSMDKNDEKLKARGLKCICAIGNDEQIQEALQMEPRDLLYFSKKLFIVHELKCLGIKVNTEFYPYTLLNRLSKSVTNSAFVNVMSLICITFTITDIKYWELIINNLIKLKMYEQLKASIAFLQKEGIIPNKQFYIDAWQNVINNLFSKNMLTEDVDVVAISNMHIIQDCPIISKINVKHVYDACLNIGRKDLAAFLLQYVPENKHELYLMNLLKDCDQNELIEKLKKLQSRGLPGCKYVIEMIKKKQY